MPLDPTWKDVKTFHEHQLWDKKQEIKWTNINSLNINLQLCATTSGPGQHTKLYNRLWVLREINFEVKLRVHEKEAGP